MLPAAVQRNDAVWAHRAGSGIARSRCHLACHWLQNLQAGGRLDGLSQNPDSRAQVDQIGLVQYRRPTQREHDAPFRGAYTGDYSLDSLDDRRASW